MIGRTVTWWAGASPGLGHILGLGHRTGVAQIRLIHKILRIVVQTLSVLTFTLLFAYALKWIRKLLECERKISTIGSKVFPLLFAPNPGIILPARCVFVAPRYGLRGTYLALFLPFFRALFGSKSLT